VARTQSQPGGAPLAVVCVPVTGLGDGVPEAEGGRMVRSAAFRLGRLLLCGGLFVLGWVLGVFLLGWAGAAPAAADTLAPAHHRITPLTTAEPGHARRQDATEAATRVAAAAVSVSHISHVASDAAFASVSGAVPHAASDAGASHGVTDAVTAVSTNAEAMAGRKVHGLTSQYAPGRSAPTAEHTVGANALAPTPGGGGSGPFGPGLGDLVRSLDDPRLMVFPVPMAGILPPVVRTAADDPSFSPD
jgi:hypothetical protein